MCYPMSSEDQSTAKNCLQENLIHDNPCFELLVTKTKHFLFQLKKYIKNSDLKFSDV